MRLSGAVQAAVMLITGAAACGEPRVAVVPPDTVVSVGIVRDTASAIPQSSGPVRLRFRAGDAGPSTVIARLAPGAIVVDGDDADWVGVPGSEIPLRSPAAAVGLTPAEWDAEWRALQVARGRCADLASCAVPPADLGVRSVSVRAAYDTERLYVLLRWSADAERRGGADWVWAPDPLGVAAWRADAPAPEDRAVLALSMGTFPAFEASGCAAACHVGERRGDVSPPAWPVRARMHSGAAGETLDVWSWRAGRTDPAGVADDLHLVEAQADDVTGVRGDCPTPPACNLFCRGAVVPVSAEPPGSDGDGGVMSALCGEAPWLAAAAPTAAASTPGERAPGFTVRRPSVHRDDVAARGRWDAATRTWTVELSRPLVTGDANDAQLPFAVHAGGDAGVLAPRFSSLRDRVLVPRCAGCHGPSSPPALDRAALVDRPSPQAPGGMPYVAPGAPERSWLLLRMRGAGGGMMPPEGAVPAAALDALETWIRNGAKDD